MVDAHQPGGQIPLAAGKRGVVGTGAGNSIGGCASPGVPQRAQCRVELSDQRIEQRR
jgi:hypothetical protein